MSHGPGSRALAKVTRSWTDPLAASAERKRERRSPEGEEAETDGAAAQGTSATATAPDGATALALPTGLAEETVPAAPPDEHAVAARPARTMRPRPTDNRRRRLPSTEWRPPVMTMTAPYGQGAGRWRSLAFGTCPTSSPQPTPATGRRRHVGCSPCTGPRSTGSTSTPCPTATPGPTCS